MCKRLTMTTSGQTETVEQTGITLHFINTEPNQDGLYEVKTALVHV